MLRLMGRTAVVRLARAAMFAVPFHSHRSLLEPSAGTAVDFAASCWLSSAGRVVSTASSPPRLNVLKRSFKASIGDSKVEVRLTVDSAYRATMAFSLPRGALHLRGWDAIAWQERCEYHFDIWQWEGRRLSNFIKLFHEHTLRDAARYGSVTWDEWDESTVEADDDQVLGMVAKGCDDVLACVDQIVRKYGGGNCDCRRTQAQTQTQTQTQRVSDPRSVRPPPAQASCDVADPQQSAGAGSGGDTSSGRNCCSCRCSCCASGGVLDYALWFRDAFTLAYSGYDTDSGSRSGGCPRSYREFIQLAACDAILANEMLSPHARFEVMHPVFDGDVRNNGPEI